MREGYFDSIKDKWLSQLGHVYCILQARDTERSCIRSCVKHVRIRTTGSACDACVLQEAVNVIK